MSGKTDFCTTFQTMTGNLPFPWQSRLYDRFVVGEFPNTASLPTGLGKTSIIAIWLIALAKCPGKVPRRLVYVVNRRTVVDQTTDEVEKFRKHLSGKPELASLKAALEQLCAIPLMPTDSPLAISTLRGQFADNREWSTDPARPAVICGTVDMIGSRLLFSGYGIGFKSKPLHAGFLGQDALLIHDEAHLEQPFQQLLNTIEEEQTNGEQSGDLPWKKLRVLELTATPRSEEDVHRVEPFRLDEEDERHPVVRQRLYAKKALSLIPLKDAKKPSSELAEYALKFENSGRAVLIFAQSVETVMEIRDKLEKRKLSNRITTLTGTMRGLERDGLVRHPIFIRFLPESNRPKGVEPEKGTVYLVCTSAGEVGVNISADHLICDLSPFDSMAQRFGRVNRFGRSDDSTITVLHPLPTEFDSTKPLDHRREKTLVLLKSLSGDASPQALGKLDPAERVAAFTPPPTVLPATDILFDSWALTSITGKLPGRPPVEPYLHGIADWEPPVTQIAWREEVDVLSREHLSPEVDIDELFKEYSPRELLGRFRLLPHELLQDRSTRVLEKLVGLPDTEETNAKSIWIVSPDAVNVMTLSELRALDRKVAQQAIGNKLLLLPPSLGGLNSNGMLDETSHTANDVAERYGQRLRLWDDNPDRTSKTEEMHIIQVIDTNPNAEDSAEELTGRRFWYWYQHDQEGERTAKRPVLWSTHVKDVVKQSRDIAASGKLSLTEDLRAAIVLAAKFHDHGKRRRVFQNVLSNTLYPEVILAKSGGKRSLVQEKYRHEFGSLVDLLNPSESDRSEFAAELAQFSAMSQEMQDVVLHLIATHHGWGRPHFDPEEGGFDPERSGADEVAREVPRRYARLQRRYGRWGLAYLESLLRAADWVASSHPSESWEDK